MNKINLQIWKRNFELPVIYQNYPGESVTETQRETLQSIAFVDFDSAKDGVISYIRKWFSSELGDDSLDNLFRFVMPESVLVSRTDGKRVFALMSDFKLDMEHGIAIVFENENFKAAGPQDIIL